MTGGVAPLAAAGFSLGDPFDVGLAFLGVVLVAAVAALPHEHERAYSVAVLYIAVGAVLGLGLRLYDRGPLDPIDDHLLLQRVSEAAMVLALFATGLRLRRRLTLRGWSSPIRLLGFAMVATIAAVAAWGAGPMGLSLGAAVALGAALAPTDPVLAGGLGVGPPGAEEEEREAEFALTSEAGLNDGLGVPFVVLGTLIAAEGGTGWLGKWIGTEVLYGAAGGLLFGGVLGYLFGQVTFALRRRGLLVPELDGWLGVAGALLIYGAAQALDLYGFLAVLAGGVGFRQQEFEHAYNRRVHDGAEVVKTFAELVALALFGAMLTWGDFGAPGAAGWLLVPLLIVVIRPLLVFLSLAGTPLTPRDRVYLAWFGVKGIASLNYLALIVGAGAFPAAEEGKVAWTIMAAVLVSVVVHGLTATPLVKRLR
ncbi:MAG: cation:proton antiporter [Thermoleophilaceae bacterium]|nr:cation:proton antiporter [Thermoleophilaceae bacterium]